MPRISSNPMKNLQRQFRPKEVSVCTLVYIPEMKGYWEQSFDVLKVCLSSLMENTAEDFDLVVLDNGSCPEVREFLAGLVSEGVIQLLLLSGQNMGKTGAWNSVFPACPGKYIAFTDSDVIFLPGWLTKSLEVMNTFDNVGMVTARPHRGPRILRDEMMSTTLAYAENAPHVTVERGALIPQVVMDEHWRSVGAAADRAILAAESEDVLLTKQGVQAFAYAGHYQFLTRRDTALKILPLQGERALAGDEKLWDRGINELGLLRLATQAPLVRHVGNTLSDEELQLLSAQHPMREHIRATAVSAAPNQGLLTRNLKRIATVPRVRRYMERAYSSLFAALQ